MIKAEWAAVGLILQRLQINVLRFALFGLGAPGHELEVLRPASPPYDKDSRPY